MSAPDVWQRPEHPDDLLRHEGVLGARGPPQAQRGIRHIAERYIMCAAGCAYGYAPTRRACEQTSAKHQSQGAMPLAVCLETTFTVPQRGIRKGRSGKKTNTSK